MVNKPINEQPANDAVEQRARELFNAQVANQDAHTRSRLNQARQAALAAARGNSRSLPYSLGGRWMLPVGSIAALALVTLSALQFMKPASETTEIAASTVATVDDVEILTSSDELEMLQDMEFYAWLETQEGVSGDLNGDAGASEPTSEAG